MSHYIQISESATNHIPSLAKLDPNLVDLPNQPPDDSLISPDSNFANPVAPVIQVTSDEFVNIIDSVKQAIEEGIYPVRISKGSSGSYFCKNNQGVIVGVFKPKNEEPYGHLKYFQFNKALNGPNGFTGIYSHVVLADHERWMHRIMKTPLKPKIGSFQLFLNGFVDSTSFFHDGFQKLESNDGNHPLSWSENSKLEFQYGFERLVILDYFIRNTDRGSDNWMIKSSPWQEPQSPASSSSQANDEEISIKRDCKVQIAAIDNGLAFPTHHPDRVRSYPYGWTALPIVHQPFSKATADQVLPYLSSTSWMEATLTGIEVLFQIDSDFKQSMWERQKAVIRGQGYNIMDMLAQSRHHPISPFTLVQRPLIMIHEDPVDEEEADSDEETEESTPAKRFLNLQKKNLKKAKHPLNRSNEKLSEPESKFVPLNDVSKDKPANKSQSALAGEKSASLTGSQLNMVNSIMDESLKAVQNEGTFHSNSASTDAQPKKSGSQAALNKSQPSLNEAAAIPIKASDPALNKSQPALNKSQPNLAQQANKTSEPALNKSQPALNKSQPALNKSQPTLADQATTKASEPAVHKSQSALNKSQPALTSEPVHEHVHHHEESKQEHPTGEHKEAAHTETRTNQEHADVPM
ncbi:phosphatidyl inositol kinase [Boothiomyces sp. JEL0838]|nr:phosphatidyl inositol kinase [Boothiomyces sp. JEL0838]